jgi:hypothetical protein
MTPPLARQSDQTLLDGLPLILTLPRTLIQKAFVFGL